MKTGITAMPLLAFAAMFTACATGPQTAQQPPQEMHTIQSTYTQDELQATGRSNTGSALRHIDPDVR